jgi:hypothetical protein
MRRVRARRLGRPWATLAAVGAPMARGWTSALFALGLMACPRPDNAGGARLSARWTGADSAVFAAPVVGEWCAPLRVLQIRAVAGDTGLALATYPGDSIVPGVYPIRPPDVADTARPPAAAAAVRWFSKTVVQGYASDSGRLTLRRGAGGELAGDFKAWAHAITGANRIVLTGSLDGLRPGPAPPGCAGRGRSDSTSADTLEAADDTSDGVD